MLGFFSFTEITDPGAHEAYNLWHLFDHQPEQFTIDGINFGERWVRSPRCRSVQLAPQPLFESFHYMTLYLLRDESVIPPVLRPGEGLARQGSVLQTAQGGALRSLRGGGQLGRTACPRVARGGALPALSGALRGGGPAVDAAALVEPEGVAGVWQFAAEGRHITVAFVDGDLWGVAADLGALTRASDRGVEWAGPLEPVDASGWDWFATLSGS